MVFSISERNIYVNLDYKKLFLVQVIYISYVNETTWNLREFYIIILRYICVLYARLLAEFDMN